VENSWNIDIMCVNNFGHCPPLEGRGRVWPPETFPWSWRVITLNLVTPL